MTQATTPQRDWHDLTADEQLALLEAYGRYLDGLPPRCDLDAKIERFRRWLSARAVRYTHPAETFSPRRGSHECGQDAPNERNVR